VILPATSREDTEAVAVRMREAVRALKSNYPPAKPGALRLLAPQRGLIATDERHDPRLRQFPTQI
jgi:hypothetical protein